MDPYNVEIDMFNIDNEKVYSSTEAIFADIYTWKRSFAVEVAEKCMGGKWELIDIILPKEPSLDPNEAVGLARYRVHRVEW